MIGRSQYGGSTSGRRRQGRQRSAPTSMLEGEEEEGYGSGDFEENFELVRIKVKVSAHPFLSM